MIKKKITTITLLLIGNILEAIQYVDAICNFINLI